MITVAFLEPTKPTVTILPTACRSTSKNDLEAILSVDLDSPDVPVHVRTKIKALRILIKNKELDEEKNKETIKLFEEYIGDVSQKKIILRPKEGYRNKLDFTIKDYEVRFASKRKLKRYKKQYEYFRKETAKRYRWAIYITLTIDPRRSKTYGKLAI